MDIIIYNTLTKRKEIFIPVEKNKIKIYVCGPTVYDLCHIGHARSAVFFDVVTKYLKNIGYDVTYVRNFTDIDDKIIFRSNDLGIDFERLSNLNIKLFKEDMDFLKIKEPNFQPRVTRYIDTIIEFIKTLVKKKFAYEINGNVYFSVDKCKNYGKLSGREKKMLDFKSRTELNYEKKFHSDFSLWKKNKDHEPFWPSPWGYGRPGWHIECSAIINKILGATIDIHGGGEDLIFPHHENEKIQSEMATGEKLAKYWMHNGLVKINNTKMSKSLGNWESIEKLSKKYNSETIRFFLLSNYYRKPINFSKNYIESSKKAIDKLHKNIKKIFILLGEHYKSINKISNFKNKIWNDFCKSMNNDFNTAKSIAIIFDSIKNIKTSLKNGTLNLSKKTDIGTVCSKTKEILNIGEILGIINSNPEKILQKSKIKDTKKLNLLEIKNLIEKRNKARNNKEWDKADNIRKILEKMNIQIQDSQNKTKWKYNKY